MRKLVRLGVLMVGLCAFSINATPIEGFALLVDGVPNGEADELRYLNLAIEAWNENQPDGTALETEKYFELFDRGSAPALVLADTSYTKPSNIGSGSVILDGTAEYIVTHWGGFSGGVDIMYYVGGKIGTFELSLPYVPPGISVGGLSSIMFVGGSGAISPPVENVPDGGTSIALFGIGLCGICSYARYTKK